MDDFLYSEWVGYVAGLLTTLAFLPQALKTWRSRSADDLSLGMFVMFCIGIFLWLVYGLLRKQLAIILPNVFTLLLAGSILYIKLTSFKK